MRWPGRETRLSPEITDSRDSVYLSLTTMRSPARPGQRHYAGANAVRKVQGGMGTSIVSTSHGVMTGHQAREQGVGGEVVAEVW